MIRGKIAIGSFDFVKKTHILRYYKFFRSTLNWSSSQVKKIQEDKLQDIIRYSYENSKFYRRRFEENNLTPDNIKKPEDLNRIPPLTRTDLQQDLEEIQTGDSKGFHLKSSSSGTTGIPVSYYLDKDGYSAGVAAGYFLWSLSGWEPGQRGIHVWGNPHSQTKWKTPGSKIKQLLYNQKYFPASDLNFESRMPGFFEVYNSFKPDYIDGYSQSLYSIASYLKEHKTISLNVKNILGTAENLFDYQKETIEKYLGPFSDLYGFGEINGIAIKPSGSSRFLIADPRVYVEAGREYATGMKEIIVTDLYNRIMPLIRYQPGDLFPGLEENHDLFPQFRAFEKVIGRTANIIELGDGRIIHPVNLLGGTFFRKFLYLRKHKVIWDGNQLEFIFEVEKNADPDKTRLKIQEYLQDYDIPITVTITDQIFPGETGKYNYIENRAAAR